GAEGERGRDRTAQVRREPSRGRGENRLRFHPRRRLAVELAVIIPALSERENLELLLPALSKIIGRLGANTEIVVVDGGSQDGTPEAAEHWGARVVFQKERGYGGALLAGFAATT